MQFFILRASRTFFGISVLSISSPPPPSSPPPGRGGRGKLTVLGHALRSLHAGVEHLLGRHEEDAVGRLLAVHHFQLLHQEVDAAVRVLLPDLEGRGLGLNDLGR